MELAEGVTKGSNRQIEWSLQIAECEEELSAEEIDRITNYVASIMVDHYLRHKRSSDVTEMDHDGD